MLLLLIQLIDLYTIVVLAAVVLTWIRLSPGNPVLQFIQMLTEPVLAPARRIIPPLGGLDISPMLVMIALQAIRSVLVRSFRSHRIRFFSTGTLRFAGSAHFKHSEAAAHRRQLNLS